jgi:hypothetical protein
MRIELNKAPFANQNLVIESSGYLKGPTIYQNGIHVPRLKGEYALITEDGTTTNVKLVDWFWDPIPQLKIGDEKIQFATPFKWYELTWIVLPFLVLLTFGFVGGLGGVVSSRITGRLFRSERSTLAKYTISGLASIGIILLTALLAMFVQSLIPPR